LIKANAKIIDKIKVVLHLILEWMASRAHSTVSLLTLLVTAIGTIEVVTFGVFTIEVVL